MVPKPKNRGLRFVVDLRALNDLVEVECNVLPGIEMQLSLATTFGIYKMVAAPMGFTNTPTVFQSRMMNDALGGTRDDSIFGTSPAGVLQWVDHSVIYSTTWTDFLRTLQILLANVIKFRVRLNY